ncbi:MAG: O-antigen ligase family protein [Lentimicrobiaceae bacterium]|nr:O-antigen ligase family protein [Lentimicrobiaceae bacterium]
MNRALFFSRCYFILLVIAVITIPFTKLFYFIITPLLLILWIIEGEWKSKWNRLKESHTVVITGILALFWLMNLIGLFYANDLTKGLMRTYDKLPFLVYPLVFFTLNKEYFTLKKLHTLFKWFLFATVVMLMMNWGNAFIRYFTTGEARHFYYNDFSQYSCHTSYASLLVCIAFIIAFYFLNASNGKSHISCPSVETDGSETPSCLPPHTSHPIPLTILLSFYAISIYFLQSRTGILAFIVVSIFSLFYYFHTRKKTFWYGIVGTLIVLLFTFTIIKLFPGRVGHHITNIEQQEDKNVLGLRSEIWSITYQLAMKNKMLGIGTGYHAESYLTDAELEIFDKNRLFINAHNQFLQTFLDHGIFALLLLVFFIINSFYFAIKTRNYLLFMLMISIFINILFESMLERGHGIFAFSLFYCLFIAKNNIFATAIQNSRDIARNVSTTSIKKK